VGRTVSIVGGCRDLLDRVPADQIRDSCHCRNQQRVASSLKSLSKVSGILSSRAAHASTSGGSIGYASFGADIPRTGEAMPEWRPNHPKSGKTDTQGLPFTGAFNRLILALTYALTS
jgi:hypothetical protein